MRRYTERAMKLTTVVLVQGESTALLAMMRQFNAAIAAVNIGRRAAGDQPDVAAVSQEDGPASYESASSQVENHRLLDTGLDKPSPSRVA